MKHLRNLLLFVILASCAAAESSENLVRFSSQPNDWFQSFEFRSRPVAGQDDADTVIVLLSKDLKSLDSKLLDPKWQSLIAKNRVGIVALGYTVQSKPPKDAKPGSKSLYALNPKAGQNILNGELKRQIRKIYPRVKYCEYVTWDDAAFMAAGFIGDSPKETRIFVMEDQLWGVPEGLRSLPACLVINRNQAHTARMLEVMQTNRTKKWDISFVRAAAGERKSVDQFIVDYMSTILSGHKLTPAVVDVETKEQFKAQVPRDKIANTIWLPDVSLIPSWQALHSIAEKDRVAEIVMESVVTGVAAQPNLNLYLKMPSTLKSGEMPKGVFCIATWMSADKSMHDLLRYGIVNKSMVDWANANQFALICWNTVTLWKSGVGEADLERATRNHFDDNFDAMAKAWDNGIRRLITKYALPEDGYLFYGISRGAHWGHRLALRRPERFAAVHFHVANSYDIPDEKAKNVLWLITSGELDAGHQASLDFYRKCRSLGYPIILKAAPNLGHADREDIQKLGLAFFQYAVGLRNEVGQTANSIGAPAPSAIADLMRRDLAKSTFFGDFINQGVYQADQASWVPTNQQIPLASSDIAKVWGKQEGQ